MSTRRQFLAELASATFLATAPMEIDTRMLSAKLRLSPFITVLVNGVPRAVVHYKERLVKKVLGKITTGDEVKFSMTYDAVSHDGEVLSSSIVETKTWQFSQT